VTFPGIAILAFLGRHATRLLVGAIFIGVALPPLAAVLRPYLSLWIFLLTVSTLLRVDPAAVIAHAKRPGRIILILAWILLATPLLMVAVLSFIPLPRGLVEPLVLWSASPPLASSPAFAFLVGLDGPLALLLMVTATFLMPFTVPPLVLALIGLKLDIGVFELMGRLVLFVGVAAAIAFAVRRLIGPLRMARRATELNGLTVVALVLFGIAVMDGMQAHLRERPGEVLLYAAVTFGATLVQQAVATVAFLWLGRVDALTTGLVTGNKNMAIIWANLGVAAPPEVMLYFAVIQLPIFILPAALRPVYRWALRRREPALTRVGAEQ
jgi:BASS family bile acid:Na+ symporter